MRILAWNCRRASATNPLWSYFEDLAPDIAVLQEVSAIPQAVRDSYDIQTDTPPTRVGDPQRFLSALLVRGKIKERVPLRTPDPWVNEQLTHFQPNLLAYSVAVHDGSSLTIVGVYAPAWPVARESYRGLDVTAVKLPQNPEIWVTDLLVAALRHRTVTKTQPWVVAGDFNACESFDQWKGGPRGNRVWLDRMSSLGFVECLRYSRGALTPTFRRPGKRMPHCQIDHLFVTQELAGVLQTCSTGDPERVFGANLSDHLPIVADFHPAPSVVVKI